MPAVLPLATREAGVGGAFDGPAEEADLTGDAVVPRINTSICYRCL